MFDNQEFCGGFLALFALDFYARARDRMDSHRRPGQIEATIAWLVTLLGLLLVTAVAQPWLRGAFAVGLLGASLLGWIGARLRVRFAGFRFARHWDRAITMLASTVGIVWLFSHGGFDHTTILDIEGVGFDEARHGRLAMWLATLLGVLALIENGCKWRSTMRSPLEQGVRASRLAHGRVSPAPAAALTRDAQAYASPAPAMDNDLVVTSADSCTSEKMRLFVARRRRHNQAQGCAQASFFVLILLTSQERHSTVSTIVALLALTLFIAALATAIVLSIGNSNCPRCDESLHGFGRHCPDCGAAELEPPGLFRPRRCHACAKSIIPERKGRRASYTTRYCSHCGGLFDLQGI